ncbi:serine O-acetyltransferase [Anaerolineae bacterium]|nr:serine O-acetyltransferase [Anaerolineae bacterium]
MIRRLAKTIVRVVIRLAYAAYKAEGINALLLLMPAKLIAPTLRQHGARIGAGAEIHSPLIIHNAGEVRGEHYAHLIVGDECYFGREVLLDLKDELRFEERVTVSMRVTFITHTDVGRSPLAARIPPGHAPIVVRRGAYVGAGAMILQGVEIGEEAVVGAGAMVNHDVPAHSVVAGVPARVIRTL